MGVGPVSVSRFSETDDNGGDAAVGIDNFSISQPPPQTRYVATTGSDSGPNDCLTVGSPCATIANAIAQANSGDTISIAAGTYTQSFFVINKDLAFVGAGAAATTIQASTVPNTPTSRIFDISSSSNVVSISGLTLQNAKISDVGAAIRSNGVLTVTDSVITANVATNQGGAIANYGTLNLSNSTVSGNTADSWGGGIVTFGPTTITNSTISGNTSNNVGADGGGGIRSGFSTLTISNSTIAGNTAPSGSGGGIRDVSGTVIVRSSIIAGNTDGGTAPDVDATVTSQGYNLIGDGTGSTGFSGTADQVGSGASPIDPLLGPLQNNGGQTLTHALLFGSSAIDQGSAFGATTDQRGVGFAGTFDDVAISNADDGTDIGAYESPTALLGPATVQFSEHNPQGSETGPITITVTRSGDLSTASSVGYTTLGGGGACTTGVDFLDTSGTLNFAANETQKQFDITTCDDDIYEGSSEGFEVKLQNPVGAVLGTENDVTFSILENDGIPTFDIGTAATSVDEGVGTVTITVNRSGAPGNVVTVELGITGGTATMGASCIAGVDYVGGGQTLSFAAGETSKTYDVTICNDTTQEPAETFTATLSNPQYPSQLGTTTSETVTINASDGGAPVVYVDSSWAGTTIGTDPDGAGPATSFGTDSFATIADGIAGVADGGELIINPGTYTGDMRIGHPSIIKGKFAITGELEAQVPGVVVSPGQSPGIITSGSLVLTSGSELDIELNGTNPGTGHDQMKVTAGPVDLGGATLVLSALGGYRPTAGDQFTIINNQGADPVIGTFAGLAEAATVSDGTSTYTISYTGGDGNDVVLTATSGSCGNVVSIPAVASPTGVSVTVPVNTTDLSGISPSVIASDFTVSYDPAVLSSSGITATLGSAVPNTNSAIVTINSTTSGVVVVSVFAPYGITAGSIVDLHFNVIGSAGSAGPLTVTGGGFNGGLVCSSSTGGTIDVVPATTATTVTTSGSPSTYGAVVTFTATVTAATPSLGTPVTTGSVEFYDGTCGVGSPFFTGIPDGSGEVTAPISSLTAGSHTIGACYLANTDFTASSNTVGQTVNPAAPVITVTGSDTFTYNGSPQGPDTADTGGSTSVPTFSYSGTSNGSVVYGPSSTKPTLAGSYTVTASVVADANFTAATSAPFAFTIGRATPVVTVTGSTTFTYNGSPQGPSSASTGGSTGTLSFSYSGSPNGGGTYGPLATPPTAAGSYTVTASVAQDDNYAVASSSSDTVHDHRATPTLSVTNSPVGFDRNPHSAAVSASVPGSSATS